MEKTYSIQEVKKELADFGINPNDMFENDTFCQAFQNYRKGLITIDYLLDVAEEIYV